MAQPGPAAPALVALPRSVHGLALVDDLFRGARGGRLRLHAPLNASVHQQQGLALLAFGAVLGDEQGRVLLESRPARLVASAQPSVALHVVWRSWSLSVDG
ncbi:hypothetical protein BG418_21780 [Streptomyces sp. CBMA152]|nr:hypothetical protein [Streptomyces sp. CBMA152]